MIAGIDIGGTNTQGIVLDGKRIVAKCTVEGGEKKHALMCYDCLCEKSKKKLRVVFTGGGARKIGSFPAPYRKVGEISAIGKGGMYISGKKNLFVASIGTGTAFVSVKNGKSRHLGGTGIGGGTVKGLSLLMIGKDPEGAEKLALKGKGKMDLTVNDIVGSGIGKIPGSATASNFGKACRRWGKNETSHSLLKMIGETIGSMSYFAAKTINQENCMLMCGRVALNSVVKKRISYTVKMMGGKAEFPKNAEYCAAIGAAL